MNTLRIRNTGALLVALLGISSISSTFGAAVVGIDPKITVTASMDGGTTKSGNTWYEVGVNAASNTTGLATGIISGFTDPLSTYIIKPATVANALMLDNSTKNGTLTFARPLSITALSLAGSSGNGSGSVIPTLHFSDNSSSTLSAISVGDWFNNNPRAQTTKGRIDLGANSFNNVGADNPRILALNATLSAEDSAKFITSVDLAWTGGANTHTAIFGISGDVTGIGHFTAIPLTDGSYNQDIIVGLQEVPEPGTLALVGIGALGLAACYRRRMSK